MQRGATNAVNALDAANATTATRATPLAGVVTAQYVLTTDLRTTYALTPTAGTRQLLSKRDLAAGRQRS